MEQKKYDIFISYSRADVDIVRSLVGDIHARTNARCWVDWKGIESGEQFVDVIINAIDKVDTVLFVLSDKSMSSKYVKKEITYARNTGKKIIPVVIDGNKLRGWFLFEFGQTDYIDINSRLQYDKLIGELLSRYGKPVDKDVEKEEKENSNDEAHGDDKSHEQNAGKEKNKELDKAGTHGSNKKYVYWLLASVLPVSFFFFFGYLIWSLLPGEWDIWGLFGKGRINETLLVHNMAETHAGHAYVDLGLPSGTKWATCNMGLAKEPQDAGKYYSWGEAYAKSSYSDRNSATLGVSINSISNDSELDVATQKWGAGWRIPTKEEFEELFDSNNCHYSWEDGGCVITSKKNGKSIFLPACGYRNTKSTIGDGSSGYYWTATPYDDDFQQCAYCLTVSGEGHRIDYSERYKGLSVRPVWGETVNLQEDLNATEYEVPFTPVLLYADSLSGNPNIYNLQGERIPNIVESGTYIIGGKKVLVK